MGTVQAVLDSGDVRVRFSNRVWTLNPDILTPVSMMVIKHAITVNLCMDICGLSDG